MTRRGEGPVLNSLGQLCAVTLVNLVANDMVGLSGAADLHQCVRGDRSSSLLEPSLTAGATATRVPALTFHPVIGRRDRIWPAPGHRRRCEQRTGLPSATWPRGSTQQHTCAVMTRFLRGTVSHGHTCDVVTRRRAGELRSIDASTEVVTSDTFAGTGTPLVTTSSSRGEPARASISDGSETLTASAPTTGLVPSPR